MSPRSKANSLLAPCFAEPLTVCLQQTIDLSILSPKQLVRGTRAPTGNPSFNSNKIGIGKKREEREASNCISFSFSFSFVFSLPYEDCNGKLTLPKHGRRIQATINCSFFLSHNQIEQKKLLPETFLFFFHNFFFSGDTC